MAVVSAMEAVVIVAGRRRSRLVLIVVRMAVMIVRMTTMVARDRCDLQQA